MLPTKSEWGADQSVGKGFFLRGKELSVKICLAQIRSDGGNCYMSSELAGGSFPSGNCVEVILNTYCGSKLWFWRICLYAFHIL